MRIKKALALFVLMSLIAGSTAWASVGIKKDGVFQATATDIDFKGGPSISGNDTVSVDYSTLTLTAGTINGVVIGGVTPAAGTFTNLTSNGNTIIGDAAADTEHHNANTITYEGATADAFETTLAFTDPTADQTSTVPNFAVNFAFLGSTLTSNSIDAANSIWGVSNGLVLEGATADAFETTLTPVDPTADQTVSIPNFAVNYAVLGSTLTTNNIDAANSVWASSNGVEFEGATADAFETKIAPVDPTVDQIINLPNVGVNSALLISTLTTNTVDAANSVWAVSNGVVLEGATVDAFETTISPVDPTADQTISIPNNGAASALMTSALTTNAVDVANSVTGASNAVLFEGATADAFETTLVPFDVTADATITLPTKTGTLHGSGAVVALTPGATPTLTVVPGRHVVTYQPADNTDATFNASGAGSAGDSLTFIFTTDAAGAGDEVMTFGTNMTSTGTLTMANLASDIYTVSFVSDGSGWREVARTAVQTT